MIKGMSTKRVALAGVLTALTFVMTYFVRIPIPATEGYVNLGDTVILISSFLLGPFAAIPAAVGSALADLLAGYAHYIIPTAIIKGAMGAACGAILMKKRTLPFRIVAFVVAEVIMVGGYFGFESLPFMYGVAAALLSVPFNALQGLVGIVAALPITYVRILSKRDIISG
ncbi:Uncharacterized membrane protein [Ruminococcaceae bacterium YRB3002]|nr:Uncharacterized membrane protein [Ruminococcaceae bacterium YRB3002]